MSNLVNHCQALKTAIDADDQPAVVRECCLLLFNCLPNPQATIQNTQILAGSGPDATKPIDDCIQACEDFCKRPQRTKTTPEAIDPNTIIQLVQLVIQVIGWFRHHNSNVVSQQPPQTPAQPQPPKK